MKVFLTAKSVFTVALALCALQAQAQKNVAYQDLNVRISLDTDGVARLEYSPDGKFEDGRSFVAVNRDYPAVKFSTRQSGKNVEITTAQMVIR